MPLSYTDRDNIPAHCKKVEIYSGNIATDSYGVSCLALAGIGKITSLTFQLRFPDPLERTMKHGRIEWIPLKLETAGGASPAVPEWDKADDTKKLDGKKVFDKNGVKIYREYFYDFSLDDTVSSRTWVLRIENGSEYDIQVALTGDDPCSLLYGQVGRGQTTYAEVYEDVSKRPKGEALPTSVSGVPEIYDFTKTKKLFTGDEKITLTVPD